MRDSNYIGGGEMDAEMSDPGIEEVCQEFDDAQGDWQEREELDREWVEEHDDWVSPSGGDSAAAYYERSMVDRARGY